MTHKVSQDHGPLHPTALLGLLPALLLLALLLGGCVSAQSWEATRLLEDIDAGARPSDLKAATPAPGRTTLRYEVEGRPGLADLYDPRQPIGAALVLVPGFTREGKNDQRVVNLARSLARARFLVLVPDVTGSRQFRVRLDDARTIADAVTYLSRQEAKAAGQDVGVVAISYAVGLAVLAGLEVEEDLAPDFLVGIGGYYDSEAIITFATTGKYRPADGGGWRSGKPLDAAKWVFLASNAAVLSDMAERRRLQEIGERCIRGCDAAAETLAEGLGPEGRALLDLITNEDPERVPALLAALPETVKRQLERLSLQDRDLSRLTGRLILIHGRLDSMIPYTESQALAAAVPESEIFVIDGFSHITPRDVGWIGQLQLIDAALAVLKRRR